MSEIIGSKYKPETDVDSLEGWSIVRHRDDVGSDADSVEVISDDSDRDTCDEGKDVCDDENKTDEAADSTTKDPATDSGDKEEVGDTEEIDRGSDLAKLDPLGDFIRRLSGKLHEFLLVPRDIQNDRSHQELKLRYVIIASALLALICSLLVSSYLLFHKFQELSKISDETTSAKVLQDLEQALSRLQSVINLENEQRLKDIISKVPSKYLSPEKMASNDRVNKRKPFKRSQAIRTVSRDDFGVTGIQEAGEMKPDRQVERTSLENEKHTASSDYRAEKSRSPNENGKNVEIDQGKPLNEKIPLLVDQPLSTNDNPKILTIADTINSDHPTPAKEPNDHENLNDLKLDNHITILKDSELFDSNAKDILVSVRQDVLSVQNQLYSQIMNSLFEYKIDLYKNVMRAGLDSACNADHSNKKSNHKKFMLLRNLQNIIAKSSESNFELWYKFYSYAVSPRFRLIMNKLDSVINEPEREKESIAKDGVVMEEVRRSQQSASSDDFFVRSSVPYDGSNYETGQPEASKGFDWKNLDKKIKESMNKVRITSKDQSFTNNEETLKTKEETKVPGNGPSSENIDQNGEKPNLVEAGKTQGGRKIYDEKKAFEKTPGTKSERSFKKGERKKTSDGSGDRKQENTYKKNNKSTNKHDPIDDDGSKFNKQDKNYNFQKHAGGKNRNFEYSKESRDQYGKERGKYEHKARMNGGTREHFDKDYCSGARCDRSDEKDYYFHDGRQRRKSFLNNMTKYVKKAASGLWKTVKGGFKKVKNYSSYIKDWHTGEDKGKGHYEEWRKEFMKEMKDVLRVLGGNPAINGLYELPKSVTRFFGDGLGNLMNTERDWDEEVDADGEGVGKGPVGMKLDECNTNDGGYKMGGYGTCSPDDSEDLKEDDSDSDSDSDTTDSEDEDEVDKASWYTEAARHRAKSRGETFPGARLHHTDPSWFLGLGRHRSYLRRRGIHLDDDGSWFISSARHRAKMRQRHTDSPQLSPHFGQSSSKR